jgi:hypothetical protein
MNLLKLLNDSADSSTAFGEYNPRKFGKLHNHCGCVSYAVQKILGGTIRTGKVCGVKHYWNLIDGQSFDYTASQFNQPINHIANDFGRDAPTRKTINPRFKKFWDQLKENQKNENN